MQEQTQQIQSERSESDKYQYGPSPEKYRELDPEFSKYILDSSKLKQHFLEMFCGYRYYKKPVEKKDLDSITKEWEDTLAIDENARLADEKLAEHLYGILSPMVGATTTSGNLTAEQSGNTWNGVLIGLIFDIEEDFGGQSIPVYGYGPVYDISGMPVYDIKNAKNAEGITKTIRERKYSDHAVIEWKPPNTFKIKSEARGTVITTVASFNLQTLKAVGGFTLRNISPNNRSEVRINQVVPGPETEINKGLGDKITNIIKGTQNTQK